MKTKLLKIVHYLKNHIFSFISLILVIIYVVVGFVSLYKRDNGSIKDNSTKVLLSKKGLYGLRTDNLDNIDIRELNFDISQSLDNSIYDNSFGYDLFSTTNATQYYYGYVLNYLNCITAKKLNSLLLDPIEEFSFSYKYSADDYINLRLKPCISFRSNYFTGGQGVNSYSSEHSYYDDTLGLWLPLQNDYYCLGDNLSLKAVFSIYVSELSYKFTNPLFKEVFDNIGFNNFEICIGYDDYYYSNCSDTDIIKKGDNFKYNKIRYSNLGFNRPKELNANIGYDLLEFDIPLISTEFVNLKLDNDYNKYLRPLNASLKYYDYYNALLNSLKNVDIIFKYNKSDLVSFAGFCDGYYEGEQHGYIDGYDGGYGEGEIAGYELGHNDGLKEGQKIGYENAMSSVSITDLFVEILETPYNIIKNGLNFEIFGVNFGGIVTGLVSILLVAFVIKKIV